MPSQGDVVTFEWRSFNSESFHMIQLGRLGNLGYFCKSVRKVWNYVKFGNVLLYLFK